MSFFEHPWVLELERQGLRELERQGFRIQLVGEDRATEKTRKSYDTKKNIKERAEKQHKQKPKRQKHTAIQHGSPRNR